MRDLSFFPVGLSILVPDPIGPALGLGRGMWGWLIRYSYVIGRGNTATAYLQAGMIRPVPGATADAVVDVQGGSGRRVPQKPKGFLFSPAEKTRTTKSLRWHEGGEGNAPGWVERNAQRPIAEGQGSAENLLGGNIIE